MEAAGESSSEPPARKSRRTASRNQIPTSSSQPGAARGSRSPGKIVAIADGATFGRARRARLLHSRRISQYACAHAAGRDSRPGLGDSSRAFPRIKGLRRLPAFSREHVLRALRLRLSSCPWPTSWKNYTRSRALADSSPSAHELMTKMVELLHEQDAEVQLGRLLHARRGSAAAGSGAGAVSRRDDAAHAHSAQSGHLRRGRLDRARPSSWMMSPKIRAISPARSKPSRKSSRPCLRKGKVAGELDIDSHFPAAFSRARSGFRASTAPPWWAKNSKAPRA